MEPALLLEKMKSAFTRLQTKNKRCHCPSHLIDNAVRFKKEDVTGWRAQKDYFSI